MKEGRIALKDNTYLKDINELRLNNKRKFLENLDAKIKGRQGSEASRAIMEALQKKIILIENSEIFYDKISADDPSLEIYSKSKTPQEFFIRIFDYFETLERMGCSYIRIRELLLVMADMVSSKNKKIKKEELFPYIYYLMQRCLSYQGKAVYSVEIVDKYLRSKISEEMNLCMSNYGIVLKNILRIADEYLEIFTDSKLPPISFIFGVYEDGRDLQVHYIMEVFNIRLDEAQKLTKNITDLSQDTTELRTMLEFLINSKGKSNLKIKEIIRELKIRGEQKIYKSFYADRVVKYDLRATAYVSASYMEKYKIKCVFANAELLLGNVKNETVNNVIVDCKNLSKTQIEKFIGYAAEICITKNNINSTYKNKIIKGHVYKITLKNVTEYNREFTEFIKNKTKDLTSLTNKNFSIEINYDNEKARERVKFVEPDYIRIISDIHTDVNESRNYSFDFGNDFVINCGDTAGNAGMAYSWLITHIRKGVSIAGNHLGYSSVYPDLDGIQNIETTGNIIHDKNTKNKQMWYLSAWLRKSCSKRSR